jgi:hypothetical protein
VYVVSRYRSRHVSVAGAAPATELICVGRLPSQLADTKAGQFFSRLRAAEEKAWWWDMTGPVGETDQQLVVIGPRIDATADDLRALGQALARWKAEFPQARHIWGLTDLMEGRHPRTPPIYLAVPYTLEQFQKGEPVALVYVAQGTDIKAAATDLYERLSDFVSKLAWFHHPDDYSFYQR